MMLGTLVVTPSVRYTCGLRKIGFFFFPKSISVCGVKSTPAPAKYARVCQTTTTWNSFGGRAGPPFRHFLHRLMSSEFSMSVRCVISSLPVDTIPVEGALASPSTFFN
jgi:hypothetical protein